MHHHLTVRRKIIIMVSTMASLFLVALDQTIIATALGRIVEEFNSFEAMGWIVTAYLIATTITVPIAGKLSDLFGRRTMLLIGVAIFTIGSLLSGTSGSIEQLIVWRALQGIGGGIITANAFTIVADLFAARERGKWQGLIGAVFGLSSVVGPLLGGWLTEGQSLLGVTTDWRWTFYINVPVGIVAFILISIYSPALRHAKKAVIDYAGAALLTLSLATFVLAIDNTEMVFADLLEVSGMSLMTLRLIMFSIVAVAVAGFVVVERRASQPILQLSFFRNRNFLVIMLAYVMFGMAFMGSILYLTQFNQQVFGASPTDSGLMLLPMVAGMMVASIGTGRLVARTGHYRSFILAGFSVASIAMLTLTTIGPDTPYLYEAIIMAVIGLGMGAGMPVLNLAIQNEFTQENLGSVTSASQLFRGLGSTIGIGVFGAILTAGIVAHQQELVETTYVQSLSSQSAAADFSDSNTLLAINSHEERQKITEAMNKATEGIQNPEAKQAARDQFLVAQEEYARDIVEAFSESLQRIFLISGLIMIGATITVSFMKERSLREASPLETPGEV